jgi:penicillin-binding protein 1A
LGFSPSVTCGVWVGYDSRESLGDKETGAVAALPTWINFMRAAIAGKDDEKFPADEPGNEDSATLDRALPNQASPDQASKVPKSGLSPAGQRAKPRSTPVAKATQFVPKPAQRRIVRPALPSNP